MLGISDFKFLNNVVLGDHDMSQHVSQGVVYLLRKKPSMYDDTYPPYQTLQEACNLQSKIQKAPVGSLAKKYVVCICMYVCVLVCASARVIL